MDVNTRGKLGFWTFWTLGVIGVIGLIVSLMIIAFTGDSGFIGLAVIGLFAGGVGLAAAFGAEW